MTPDRAASNELTRRGFHAAIGAGALSVLSAAVGAQQPHPGSGQDELRVVAYNIYAGQGHPRDKARPFKAQLPRRIAEALAPHRPDIICMAESHGRSDAITRAIANRLKMHHARFPGAGNWPGTILSRYPMTHTETAPMRGPRPEDLFTRHWGMAALRWPGDQRLIVHTAHLMPNIKNQAIRLREAEAMLKTIEPQIEAGHSVLLVGDLNHSPDGPEYQLWLKAGFVDAFARHGEGQGFSFRADRPYKRIDYVLAAGPIADRLATARVLSEPPFSPAADDENAFALSDHLPLLATFGRRVRR